MHSHPASLVWIALAIGALSGTPSGQGKAAKPVTKKPGKVTVFPLGVLGGRVAARVGSKELEVKSLQAEKPGAAGGLVVGDRILAAYGATFSAHSDNINVGGKGPAAEIGAAIEQALHQSGKLQLSVIRGDDQRELVVPVPRLGGLAAGYPKACARSLQFYDGICARLLKSRRAKDGAWQSRTGEDATRYVSALCGLALLGRGEADHLPALRKIAVFLAGPKRRGYVSEDLKSPAGLSNWFISMSGIFLAEYVLATGEQEWLPTIQHLCDCLASRQTPGGRYGHGITVGYGGRGLNIINTHAHLLWALAERAGCKLNKTAWEKSLAEVRKSTGKNGGVRYWTLQTGYSDSCARTGQMGLALELAGAAPELASRMGVYLDKSHLRMREAHAMGSIGMIFGTFALRRLNPAGWRRHMDSWRWYLSLMQQPDGSAAYIGGKRNNGGDHYLRTQHVAHAIAGCMLASGLGRLHMSGNDRKGWLKR